MNRSMPKFTEKYITRFWGRVSKGMPDECWEWQGFCFGSLGYGGFKAFYKIWLAHRIAYYLHYNEDPGELCVCYTCDNPKCCNPYHLWLGTQFDNEQDKVQKGRWNGRDIKGEKNHLAKLTEKAVRKIRRLYESGEYTKTQLAHIFNITDANVHYVVTRKTWTHI